MTLRESIASDAVSVFLSADEFAETVVYIPRGGGSRTILAIVEREPPSLLDSLGNVIALSYMIYVANSQTTGISSSEVDTGGDVIRLKGRENENALKECSVVKVMNHDNGMVQLALR